MSGLKIISADSHVMEPGDLWVERMDARFKDRAPCVVPNPEAPGFVFSIEGRYFTPAIGTDAVGADDQSLSEKIDAGSESDLRAGTGWDSAERIRAQERDGVVGRGDLHDIGYVAVQGARWRAPARGVQGV